MSPTAPSSASPTRSGARSAAPSWCPARRRARRGRAARLPRRPARPVQGAEVRRVHRRRSPHPHRQGPQNPAAHALRHRPRRYLVTTVTGLAELDTLVGRPRSQPLARSTRTGSTRSPTPRTTTSGSTPTSSAPPDPFGGRSPTATSPCPWSSRCGTAPGGRRRHHQGELRPQQGALPGPGARRRQGPGRRHAGVRRGPRGQRRSGRHRLRRRARWREKPYCVARGCTGTTREAPSSRAWRGTPGGQLEEPVNVGFPAGSGLHDPVGADGAACTRAAPSQAAAGVQARPRRRCALDTASGDQGIAVSEEIVEPAGRGRPLGAERAGQRIPPTDQRPTGESRE